MGSKKEAAEDDDFLRLRLGKPRMSLPHYSISQSKAQGQEDSREGKGIQLLDVRICMWIQRWEEQWVDVIKNYLLRLIKY